MKTNSIKVELPDGTYCLFETREPEGRESVSALSKKFNFSEVTDQLKQISQQLSDGFKNLGNSKTTLEFGVEVDVESGNLASMIVKGSAKANIKVTLEWDHNR